MLKLAYSNLEFQNFPGEDPRTPSSTGGKGKGGRGKGKEGGRGGTEEGRNGGGGGDGMGARHGLRLLETSSGSAPGIVERVEAVFYSVRVCQVDMCNFTCVCCTRV